ncbi:ArsR/SmtB family transcription factor [Promicromonospora thailandica]|uniref:Helix-turn-helix domain-containing protein n=1 Tax=Promicromonospora thailandica TaxID=765201 RepID=A0A9X2FZU9_9MICO|nr:winged helix-turn-helix domain-containing protein [Promicromonospora thailandica]MCP2263390.1 Helix-turn-helix domain-containing protein [Promicromonospora thailandica]BFF19449.1 winged helix-turn-helix domain-containing protein [Promicromonospora thailandica]
MLRFHFTADDLARVRIAPGPDPMWEVLLSAHVVNQRPGVPLFASWRERVLTDLPPAARMLLRLAPPRGYSPDFLTPVTGTDSFDSGLDAVLSTPRSRLGTDMALLTRGYRPHLWMRDLGAGSAPAVRGLGVALRAYYDHAIGPYWSGIRAAVDLDRAARTRAWVEGGTEHALRTLHPAVRWEHPVLSVATAAERDVDLAGRGLLIVPSYFCLRAPITLADPELPPVLIYPIVHENVTPDRSLESAADGGRQLTALLGRTRAAVLRALGTGATTSEIAQRLAISPASASEHATVLRNAGLVASGRERNSVIHAPTPLGQTLLDGCAGQTPVAPALFTPARQSVTAGDPA